MIIKFGRTVALAASISAILPLAALAQTYPGDNANLANSQPGGGGGYLSNPAYVPAGMTLNARLQSSISTEAARPGDVVSATLDQPIQLQNGVIPAGTVIEGHVASATSGGFLGRAGRLTVKFDRLRAPMGYDVQMAAHIVGDLGKYSQKGQGSDSFAGEGAGTKAGQALLRTAIGAGAGAALGTAVGAIAGHGNPYMSMRPVYGPYGHRMMPVGYYPQMRSGAALGAGRGAWSGAAIGGGVGLADSLLLRKGKNVVVSSGTPVQLQLDAPLSLGRNVYGAT